ncbi:MAG: hypothetical protein ACI4UF_00370 [Thermoguttaceae bacterium]
MNDYIKEAQALIKEHGLTKEAWLPSFFINYLRGFKEPKPGGASIQFPAPTPEELATSRAKYLANKTSTYGNMRKLDKDTYGEPPKYIEIPGINK